jgi:hypothetical protein
MCTSIVEVVAASGVGRGNNEWFPSNRAVVSCDHPHHALPEEAIIIDFLNPALGTGARGRGVDAECGKDAQRRPGSGDYGR